MVKEVHRTHRRLNNRSMDQTTPSTHCSVITIVADSAKPLQMT